MSIARDCESLGPYGCCSGELCPVHDTCGRCLYEKYEEKKAADHLRYGKIEQAERSTE